MLQNKDGYPFEELLDEPIYFEIEGKLIGIVFNNATREPLTLRAMYPHLHKIKLKELKRRKAFTDEELNQLRIDRAEGLSIRALAEKYNKSTTTVQKYLKMTKGGLD